MASKVTYIIQLFKLRQKVLHVARTTPRSCLGPWSRKTPDRMGKEGGREEGGRELNGRTETTAAMARMAAMPFEKGGILDWNGGPGTRVVAVWGLE